MNAISIPANPGRAAQFAAEELAKYLGQMTSHEYTVVQGAADSSGVRLSVDSTLGPDGYRISRAGAGIQIDGGDSRGCLYGAYAFLGELGCRWPLPGKQYEVVPKLDKVEWSGPSVTSKPAIKRRGMLMASRPDESLIAYVDFLAKNGLNFIFPYLTANMTDDLKARMADEMGKREMGLDYGGHWLPGMLPRDLIKDHPEYFRLDAGKRTNDLNMCASNPEAIEVMARNTQPQVDYMDAFTRPESLHLWADDIFGGGWCSCDKCKDLSGSEQLLQVLNNLADHTKLGDTKIAYIAYHGSIYPAAKVKPSSHLRLMYAARERCYLHALDGCEANKRYLEYLKADLHAMPDGAEVFDYLQDCILLRFMATPLYPTIAEDVRIYKKLGVDGVFAHAFETYSDWAYGPNAYVLGKALWRGDGDNRDVEEYCTAVYGPAGKPMKQYFDALFEFSASAIATCGYADFSDMRYPPIDRRNADQIARMAPLVSEEHMASIEAKLRTAMNVGTEPYHSRVADQMILWRYTKGEVLAIYQTLQANARETEIAKSYAGTSPVPTGVRDEMIDRYEQIVKGLESGTEIISSTPEGIRGWWGGKESGAIAERGQYGYVAAMKGRLDQWKGRGTL